MKAGLLTYHFSDNYGALYQAYALRQWLRQRGVDAEFVNYHPPYVEEGGSLDRPWIPALWRKNATILYMKQAHLRNRLFGNPVQRAQFEDFRRDFLGVRGPRFRRAEELTGEVTQYDMLICGSDQIWNPSIQRGFDPVYFLAIPGADRARKVAYAPSFGRSEIDTSHLADLGRLLSELDAISVREASGLDILTVAGVSRRKACVVPDPTILLGSFDELLKGESSCDGSVFCYALRTDKVIRDVATEAARIAGGSLRSPRTTYQRWSDIGEGIVPGPVQWLKNLAQAQIVVSNSFHGVALSIVLNRPFIAVGLPGTRAGLNARVQNLLELAGLEHRAVTSGNPARIGELLKTTIDWEAVNRRLAAARSTAETYLDGEIAAARQANHGGVMG